MSGSLDSVKRDFVLLIEQSEPYSLRYNSVPSGKYKYLALGSKNMKGTK